MLVRNALALAALALVAAGCTGHVLRVGVGASLPAQPAEATPGWYIAFDDTTPEAPGWRIGYSAVPYNGDRLSTVDAGFVFAWPGFPIEGRCFIVDMGLARHSVTGRSAWGPAIGIGYHTLIGRRATPILSARLAYSPILGDQDFPSSGTLTFTIGLSLWYYDDGA